MTTFCCTNISASFAYIRFSSLQLVLCPVEPLRGEDLNVFVVFHLFGTSYAETRDAFSYVVLLLLVTYYIFTYHY